MNTTIKNPYVGPRTFQRDDSDVFFGRDREARDLMALVASERLILFYAQSGTGKSSILNTRLIPELENNGFEVLPVGRLQGDVLTDMDIDNIYVYNLMSSIVQQKTDPLSFSHLSLSQFLAVLEFNENGYLYNQEAAPQTNDMLPWRRVLIIDQFEELFTTHLDAWKKREDFFRQLAQAMKDDPYLSVILVMREDYIASLDPYAHILLGGLRTRYYMQRLTRDMALKAVQNPVEQMRPFAEGVAEKLVEDLASIVVHKPNDVQEVHSGQYVEPVQLQVVCYTLWDRLSSEGSQITENDLTEVGDVDQSLERFYDQRVAAVANEKGVSERTIREWFGEDLITSNKTRNMVLMGANGASAITEDVIQALKGDLVRAELRAGQIWYELTHDRLVEPVLGSNAKWLEQHLSLFQRQAAIWVQQGRSEGLLLRGRELQQAEKESTVLDLTIDEIAFLDASLVHRVRKQRERRRNTLMTVLAIGATIAMIVAGVFWTQAQGSANEARNAAEQNAQLAQENANVAATAQAAEQLAQEAKQQAVDAKAETEATLKKTEIELRVARNQQLSAQAELTSQDYPSRSLLLVLESIKINTDYGDPITFTSKQALLNGLANSQGIPLSGNASSILAIKFSLDGQWLVTGDRDGSVKVWDRQSPDFRKTPAYLLKTDDLEIIHLEFSSNGQLLAGAGKSSRIYLWEFKESEEPSLTATLDTGLPGVEELKISPDGRWLVAGNGLSGKILVWDLTQIDQNKIPQEYDVDADHRSDYWDYGSTDNFRFEFSHDGYYLLALNGRNFLFLNFTSNNPYEQVSSQMYEHAYETQDRVGSWTLALEPSWAGFAFNDNYIIGAFTNQYPLRESVTLIWPINSFLTDSYQYLGFGDQWVFGSNAISTDGIWFAASSDSEISVRNLKNKAMFNLKGGEGTITDLVFSQDGRWLVSASALNPSPDVKGDGSLWIWDMTAADVQASGKAYEFNSDESVIDIDPKGEWVAVSSENQTARLFPLTLSYMDFYKIEYGIQFPPGGYIQISPDNKWLLYERDSIVEDEGSELQIADLTTDNPIKLQVIIKFGSSIGRFEESFSPDGRWLIVQTQYNYCGMSDSCKHLVYFFDLTKQELNSPYVFSYEITYGFFNRLIPGDQLSFITNENDTFLFDMRDPANDMETLTGIAALAINPSNKWLVGIDSKSGDFAAFDLSKQDFANNATVLLPSAIPPLSRMVDLQGKEFVENVRFSQDGNWVILSTCKHSGLLSDLKNAGCTGDRTIHLWNLWADNPKLTEYVLTIPDKEEILFSEDGRWIGIVADGVGKLIDLSQTPVREIDPKEFMPTGALIKISFSSDGHWLAFLNNFGRIALVDLYDPNLGAFSPNSLYHKIIEINFDQGTHILRGSTTTGDILIWEIAALLEDPSTFPLISKGETHINSDGQWLFSLTYDDLLNAVCPTIGRNLSRSEWTQYGFTEEYRATCPQFPLEQE